MLPHACGSIAQHEEQFVASQVMAFLHPVPLSLHTPPTAPCPAHTLPPLPLWPDLAAGEAGSCVLRDATITSIALLAG